LKNSKIRIDPMIDNSIDNDFQKIILLTDYRLRYFVLIIILILWPFVAQTDQLSLSLEEKNFLKSHQTLRVGVGVAFPPYMWVEKKNETPVFKGMVSDYLKILSERLGIKMQIVYDIPFNEALVRGKNKDIDFFPCLSKSPERSKFLIFTEPYFTYPTVIISRNDAPIIGGISDLSGKRFAAVEHLVVFSKLKNEYPDLNLDFVFTDKVSNNLEAVSLDKADACIINLAVASYYTHKKGFTNLQIAAPVNWKGIQLSMGVRDDWPLFKNIIQKELASIPQKEKDRISQRWIRVNYETGVDVELIWKWSLGVGSTIFVIFFLILVWNRRLKKEINGRQKAEMEREKVIVELQTALNEVKTLQGFIPICASCKKIRDDKGYWNQIEGYIQNHSEVVFSHSMCPECLEQFYGNEEWYKRRQKKNEEERGKNPSG